MSSVHFANGNRDCFTSMANACKGTITEFLGLKESILILGSLNRSMNTVIFSARNLGEGFAFRKVSLVANQAIAFLNSASKPRAIQSLIVTGSKAPLAITAPIVKENRMQNAIKDLSFNSLGKMPIPISYITGIIEATPNIDSLSFNFLRLIEGRKAFAPTDEMGLSGTAQANLASLTKLAITASHIHPKGIINFLNCSNDFQSVFFYEYRLSNDLLTALAQKQYLTTLSLSQCTGRVNYALLDGLKLLESFTPGEDISFADLIRVIDRNRGLKRLSLKSCNPNLLTEEVLKLVGEKLGNLEELSFPLRSIVTEKGFIYVVRGCKKLKELGLQEVKGLTPQALSELKKCPDLTEVNLSNTILSDECLAALATVNTLTHLKLGFCSGGTTLGLREICKLENLIKVELDQTPILTDELVNEIVNRCSKLRKLAIDDCNLLTQNSLHAISQAINRVKRPLKELKCIPLVPTYASFTLEMIQQLQTECPKLKIT